MKKLIILVFAGLMGAVMATSAQASSHKAKRPVMHHDAHAHYKGKNHMFRHHGNHDNYNPHHRKCGYMPSGSC